MLYWTKYLASLSHHFVLFIQCLSPPPLSLSLSLSVFCVPVFPLSVSLSDTPPPPSPLSLNWENLAYKPSLSSVLLYTCCLEWLPCYLLSTRDVGFLLDPIARSRSRMVKTDCRFTEGWSYFWNQSGNLILLSKSNEVAGMELYKQGYL